MATPLRCVAMCWVLLTQNLKMIKFSIQHLGMSHDAVVVGQVRATMLHPGTLTGPIFNTQYVATCHYMVAKHDMLHSNVAII